MDMCRTADQDPVWWQSFAVAGLWVWKSLPAPLRDTNSIYSILVELYKWEISRIFLCGAEALPQ